MRASLQHALIAFVIVNHNKRAKYMKKLISAASLFLLPFTSAMADSNTALNSTAFRGGQPGGGPIFFNITTDGTQTISSSFGPGPRGIETPRGRLVLFIDGNMDNLARDIARGEGETLSTLAAVWGVSADDNAFFSELVQSHFGDVFTSENVTSENVLNNLNALISDNERLAEYSLS
jgi:hypothetical protein